MNSQADCSLIGWIPDLLQFLTVLAPVVVAFYGIKAWRQEIVGRRKIELAETVLAAVYEFKDIMRTVRSVGSYDGEVQTRIKHNPETIEQTRVLDTFYAPLERIDRHSEFFSSLRSKEYQFRAYFGDSGKKPFDNLKLVHDRVLTAARQLLQDSIHQTATRLPSTKRHELERIIWNLDHEDELTIIIDTAVTEIEEICKPVLLRSGNKK